MIEITDNSIQLAVLAGCCIYTSMMSLRRNNQIWLLLTCFMEPMPSGWFTGCCSLFFIPDFRRFLPYQI